MLGYECPGYLSMEQYVSFYSPFLIDLWGLLTTQMLWQAHRRSELSLITNRASAMLHYNRSRSLKRGESNDSLNSCVFTKALSHCKINSVT